MATLTIPSEVGICNRALQKLGAGQIKTLSENSAAARECTIAYPVCRDAELETHAWSFAIKRATLTALDPAPAWGPKAYQLPVDYLRMISQDEDRAIYSTDWQVEGDKLLTNQAGTAAVYFRYVSRVIDPTKMPTVFREALACRLALELCESLTQSNTKLQNLAAMYKESIQLAVKKNLVLTPPRDFDESSWITARY